jgi:hypothetical protein
LFDLENHVMELLMKKHCCAQIVMAVGLEVQEKKKPDLIRAMRGLCNGIYGQDVCGCLSGAACLMYLFHEQYGSIMVPELFDWFERRYGFTKCGDLVGFGKKNPAKCRDMITQTCTYCLDMLEKHGLLEGGL